LIIYSYHLTNTSTYHIPSMVLDDGSVVVVKYTADENGFVADSPILPTPHPLPPHALEQILFAEAQAAAQG